jgi:hypothetical protein
MTRRSSLLLKKRSTPRFPLSASAEANDIKANLQMTGRLSDIGRRGSYMDAISPFVLNAVVILTITRDGRTFRTKAKVVDSLNAMGTGLMFTATEPEQVRVLESCLNEGTGGTLVEPDPPAPAVPTFAAPAEIASGADQELRDIVREMIVLLNRNSIVGDGEAMAMMRKISK